MSSIVFILLLDGAIRECFQQYNITAKKIKIISVQLNSYILLNSFLFHPNSPSSSTFALIFYDIQTPLWFRAVLEMGCVTRPKQHTQHISDSTGTGTGRDKIFKLDDLELIKTTAHPYLMVSTYVHVLVFVCVCVCIRVRPYV